MSLCNREASVVSLSVCPSVCPSVNFYKQVATSTTHMTRSPPNLHTMVHTWSYIQVVLKVKVKVKYHVIRTLLISRKSLLLPQTWLDRHQTYTTRSPHGPASSMCSRSSQGQRSRDTVASVMSRNVCYIVPSDVLSLHARTLRSTVTLSFQYKCQTARCNVYIMEWATPSLTVWFI